MKIFTQTAIQNKHKAMNMFVNMNEGAEIVPNNRITLNGKVINVMVGTDLKALLISRTEERELNVKKDGVPYYAADIDTFVVFRQYKDGRVVVFTITDVEALYNARTIAAVTWDELTKIADSYTVYKAATLATFA